MSIQRQEIGSIVSMTHLIKRIAHIILDSGNVSVMQIVISLCHYSGVIMSAMALQITGVSIVC